MAELYVTLPKQEMARQIATLLNNHNNLLTKYSARSLLSSEGKYFVELDGGRVVGCIAIQEENPEITKLFHLCVAPDKRRQGIAKKLLQFAIAQSTTPYVYGTIREDNQASLSAVHSLGFVVVSKEWARTHYIITVGRRTR